jgi:hypothetical protein
LDRIATKFEPDFALDFNWTVELDLPGLTEMGCIEMDLTGLTGLRLH